MAKTYKEWEDEAKKSGYYDTFSDEDLNQIKTDVAFGDSMLAGKKRYDAAETPEEKAAIADEFANERLQRGYYNTVSGDGKGGYRATSTSTQIPQTKYSAINQLLAQIAGDKFSYDPKEDKRYRLAEEYAQRAMANQMAESALLTGGYGNSYASAAGQQVYTDYMNDAVNDMEDRAYSQWAAERDNKYNLLAIARDMEQQQYDREQTERKWQYQTEQDAKADAKTAKTEAQNYVYDYIMITQGIEGLTPEEIEATGWSEGYINALVTKSIADKNAVDSKTENATENDKYAKLLEKAETLAKYGDFDTYKNLGYTEDEIAGMENYFDSKNAPKTTASAATKAPEEEKNPFDFSSVFTQLDNVGAQTYGDAVNFLTGANYSEKQAKAIANAYMMDTSNEIYDLAVSILQSAVGPEGESDLLALLRESVALLGQDATEQLMNRLTSQGNFNEPVARKYKRLLGISTEGK